MKLEINDTVRLNKLNRVYSAFPSAFKALGFNDIVRNPKNTYQLRFLKGKLFKIFAIGTGKFSNLIGIQNEDGVQILVEQHGITVLKRKICKDNYLLTE